MIAALTGWLGLTILVVAIGAALAADILRQRVRPVDGAAGEAVVAGTGRLRRVLPRSWVSGLTWLAVLLAVAAAVATILRFVRLT